MRPLGLRFILVLAITLLGQSVAYGAGLSSLPGHIPSAKKTSHAQDLGRKSASSRMHLAISLKPKDQEALSDYAKRIYDSKDSEFHHFLTPAQFADRFSYSAADLEQITSYLKSKGLTVLGTHSNRLMIEVEGSTATIENAFQIQMHDYVAKDGRIVHAPTTDPIVSSDVAPKLNGISGLNSFRRYKPALRKASAQKISPMITPEDYMTPAKIKTAYSLNSISQNGSGQSVALVEYDAYQQLSDITTYTSHFGLSTPTITVKPIDGGISTPGDGADEVTLDIELVTALAPGLSNIYVYESPDFDSLDIYSQIASDNSASVVSISWGDAEDNEDANDFNYLGENNYFLEMVTQGQSIFAASGDNGAYDDITDGIATLQVNDPASQPYVTAVGATTLELNSDNTYLFETTWSDTTQSPADGSGGGISRHFYLPSWQLNLATSGNLGSNTFRMIPDVSLDGDPNTGYAIYYNGSWSVYGGTSCATPLWAAFTSLVNQYRVSNSVGTPPYLMGNLNPSLYQIGTGIYYGIAFNDVNDGSTNLYYPATIGYDLATGWGSLNGTGLFSLLTTQVVAPGPSPSSSAFVPPSVPSGLTVEVIQ